MVTRRVLAHARVVVHHPSTGKGEQMMNAVSLRYPSHLAKPLACRIEGIR